MASWTKIVDREVPSWAKIAQKGHVDSLKVEDRVREDKKYHGLLLVKNPPLGRKATEREIQQIVYERYPGHEYEVVHGNDTNDTEYDHLIIRIPGTRTKLRIFGKI